MACRRSRMFINYKNETTRQSDLTVSSIFFLRRMNRLKTVMKRNCPMKRNCLMKSRCYRLNRICLWKKMKNFPMNSCWPGNGRMMSPCILIRFQCFSLKALYSCSGCLTKVQFLFVLKNRKTACFFAYFPGFQDMMNVVFRYCCLLSCCYYTKAWYWSSD